MTTPKNDDALIELVAQAIRVAPVDIVSTWRGQCVEFARVAIAVIRQHDDARLRNLEPVAAAAREHMITGFHGEAVRAALRALDALDALDASPGVPLPAGEERPRTFRCALYCPRCEQSHVDVGEWATRPHHTHRCAHCEFEWRIEPYVFGAAPYKDAAAEYARGRREEREAVVRELRAGASDHGSVTRSIVLRYAHRIERGAHLPTPPSSTTKEGT